jgi:hypothetical protein
MGANLKNNNNADSHNKSEKVVIVKSDKKTKIEIRTWTKEEVEADRSKAYKYAI